jgi:multidrug efflux pump
MQFNLSKWALENRSLVVYRMIAATIAGLAAFFRLGRDEDPPFVIKTMVVQAGWPGATLDDTLQQLTDRLERTLQETPGLDFLRSYTSPGKTTIFVNLKGKTTAAQIPDIWYHVRKSIGDMRVLLCRPVWWGQGSTTSLATFSGSSMASPRMDSPIAN